MDNRLLNKALRNGCSRRLAEIFACRRAPASHCDTFRGLANADPFVGVPQEYRREYETKVRSAGVCPTGKRYLATLAQYPGDPRALVESKSDIDRRHEELRDDTPIDPVGEPAEDIVNERAQQMLLNDGCDGTCSLKEWNDTKEKARASVKGE